MLIHQLQSNKINPQFVHDVQLPPVQSSVQPGVQSNAQRAGQVQVQQAEGKKRVNFNEGKLEELRTAREAENQVPTPHTHIFLFPINKSLYGIYSLCSNKVVQIFSCGCFEIRKGG